MPLHETLYIPLSASSRGQALRARPGAAIPATATWESWPTATSLSAASTSWPSDCPAQGKHTRCAPWATGWWSRADRCYSPGLQAGAGPAGRQAGSLAASTITEARQLRLPAVGRPGLPAPGCRGIRGALHAYRRTLRAPLPGHHVQLGLLPVGAHLHQPHGHSRCYRHSGPPLGHPGIRRPR